MADTTLASPTPSAASRSPSRSERQHVVLVDRLALVTRDIGLVEASTRVQVDLAVLQRRVDVEQDDQPVVDAAAPDIPLVHQGGRVRLGFLGRDVVTPERLGVDDDLGLRLRLDGVDDLLGQSHRVGLEDARVVVDGLSIDRVRVGRARRGSRRRR